MDGLVRKKPGHVGAGYCSVNALVLLCLVDAWTVACTRAAARDGGRQAGSGGLASGVRGHVRTDALASPCGDCGQRLCCRSGTIVCVPHHDFCAVAGVLFCADWLVDVCPLEYRRRPAPLDRGGFLDAVRVAANWIVAASGGISYHVRSLFAELGRVRFGRARLSLRAESREQVGTEGTKALAAAKVA